MIIRGDCVEAMRDMPEASVDAVVCDPPYGLEFMGKEWDRLDAGLPQENVWKGRHGKGGSSIGTDDSKPGSRHHVALGAGKQHGFRRCQLCGKRQFSGTPCECPDPVWGLEYRQEAPSSSVRMQRWHEVWAREAYRVLKPGGHLLAFGGSRTIHRLTCAIEDAGFEIRDCLVYMYGSGFPKSLDVSKALDRAAGAEREVVGHNEAVNVYNGRHAFGASMAGEDYGKSPVTAPATEAARQWQGWGTALKPAHEPIVLARKPLTGTVASNVTRHGTGALNVDGCRVEGADEWSGNEQNAHGDYSGKVFGAFGQQYAKPSHALGRWPSNILLDETAAELLDEQSGELVSGPESDRGHRRNADREARRNTYGGFQGQEVTGVLYGDSGGASRFFYTAKASRAERNAGLEGFAARELTSYSGPESRVGQVRSDGAVQNAARTVKQNHHPTVKPIDLMRWLCRLVTPPGGHVLDPFTGSGTTGIACALEGFTFIGIEREAEYADIAEARIAYWTEHGEKALLAMYEAERRRVTAETGQLAMTL